MPASLRLANSSASRNLSCICWALRERAAASLSSRTAAGLSAICCRKSGRATWGLALIGRAVAGESGSAGTFAVEADDDPWSALLAEGKGRGSAVEEGENSGSAAVFGDTFSVVDSQTRFLASNPSCNLASSSLLFLPAFYTTADGSG
jgi:hypothetical protein